MDTHQFNGKQCGKTLEYVIRVLDTCYEKGLDCIHPITGEEVSDSEYDALRNALEKLRPNSVVFTRPSMSNVPVEDKVLHNPPMLSLEKCSGDELEKLEKFEHWYQQIVDKFDRDVDIVSSLKMDGIAISFKYEKGELVAAGLRSGDGDYGENVIQNAKWIPDIPLVLPLKLTCDIRGEVYCKKSEFLKVNEYCTLMGKDVRSNERNHVAGVLRKSFDDHLDFIASSRLNFVAYDCKGSDAEIYFNTEKERSKFIEGLGFPHVVLHDFDLSDLDVYDQEHRSHDFLVDGIVLSINDLSMQKEMGSYGSSPTANPRGKIAWKFKDDVAQVTVKNIDWQTGRTGHLIPVLEFDGVELEGTTVTRCTAHNAGTVFDNQLGVGAVIEIVKSGKIIPKFVKMISPGEDVDMPMCPSCKGMCNFEYDMHLVCYNPACPIQQVKKYVHYLTSLGVKGIAESTVEKLLRDAHIESFQDLYNLTPIGLMNAGFTKRTSYLIVARIWMVKNPEKIQDYEKLWLEIELQGYNNGYIEVPASKFITALGIPEAGREVGRIIEQNFDDMTIVMKLIDKDWLKFDGIGEITADYLDVYFDKHQEMIYNLIRRVKPIFCKPTEGALTGKTFCFTGKFNGGKKKWQTAVEEQGGTIKGSVSKKLDYCIVGENAGSKASKARELSIITLNEQELKNLLERN